MRNVFITWFFMFSIICGCDDPNASSGADPLTGIWSETYVWDGSMINIDPPEYIHDNAITRTTTLEFAGDSITITILPPYQIFSKTRNSNNLRSSSDTLYGGRYTFRDSTLSIDLYDGTFYRWYDFPYIFESRLSDDSLYVSTEGELSNRSFIWGYSHLKTSGVFTRND